MYKISKFKLLQIKDDLIKVLNDTSVNFIAVKNLKIIDEKLQDVNRKIFQLTEEWNESKPTENLQDYINSNPELMEMLKEQVDVEFVTCSLEELKTKNFNGQFVYKYLNLIFI